MQLTKEQILRYPYCCILISCRKERYVGLFDNLELCLRDSRHQIHFDLRPDLYHASWTIGNFIRRTASITLKSKDIVDFYNSRKCLVKARLEIYWHSKRMIVP